MSVYQLYIPTVITVIEYCISSPHLSFPLLMPAHAVKEKRHFLVSLPTLSNQDRELNKEAVLSAHEYTESRILLFAIRDHAARLWISL